MSPELTHLADLLTNLKVDLKLIGPPDHAESIILYSKYTPGEVVLTERDASNLRQALSTKNVGGLGGATAGGQAGGSPISVQATIVVQGVTDLEAFARSRTQIASETASSLNAALARNG